MFLSVAHQFDYWLQLCYPEDVKLFAKELDLYIRERMLEALDLEIEDAITFQRIEVPVKYHGMGLRSLVGVLPAAWVGAII